MTRRRAPRPVADAVRRALERSAPATPLAGAQAAWPKAVGPDIAAVTAVEEEREGVLTIACEGAVWAEELALMTPQLLDALRGEMGDSAPSELRFVARS